MSEPSTKECPHCFSTIDARATVCPRCQRDIAPQPPTPAKGKASNGCLIIMGLFAALLVVAVIGQLFGGNDTRGETPSSVNCSISADSFQQRADEIMVDYLAAHGAGNGDKAALRSSMRAMSEPACAAGAKAAVLDWFDAVDAGDKAGMASADERYLSALK